MNNFQFLSSTKIVFGKDCHKNVGEAVREYADRILLHYGRGSIKRNGAYDDVTASLKKAGVKYKELCGVKPNPRLGLVNKGIELCRKNDLQLVLAVGGGSAIDSSKAIAAGTPYDGDVWDFYCGRAEVKKCLPVITVLTIPAAGSESSPASVITNEDGLYKRCCSSELIRPKISFLNPQFCTTLPDNQVVNGISDIMAHIMERYFTNTENVDFSDRMCEAGLRTMINNARKIVRNKNDYNVWAEIMWTGNIAHNGLMGMGREEDWGSHDIEHELSAIYDIAHGEGLSIIFPAWMKYVYKHDVNRFVQFAVRVWDVDLSYGDLSQIALEGIRRLENFYTEIGLPTRLSQIDIDELHFDEMSLKGAKEGPLGNFVKLYAKDIKEIFKLAL